MKTMSAKAGSILPLVKRPLDWPIVAFFFVNLLFVTYSIDLEQLVIADPANFAYPAWPLKPMIDLTHWWGSHFDPVLMARPAWWKATIWLDVILFGPFYAAALYAFIRGRQWIRVPCFVWSGIMFANVTIIMGEEYFGPHATPARLAVTLANAAWFLFPVYVTWRMAKKERPFET